MKQPNGQILHSTKGCRLELETLPEEAIESNILPVLAHIYLISIGKLCDDGCEASFNQHNIVVTKDEEVLLKGTKYVMTGLCRVPLQILHRPTNQSNHLHQVHGKDNAIKYVHTLVFSPVKDTPYIGITSTHGWDSLQRTSIR